MFSPTQFGLLCLSLQAFFVARVPLSWIAGEVSVSTSAARATGTPKRDAARSPPAATRAAIVCFITSLPLGLSKSERPLLGKDTTSRALEDGTVGVGRHPGRRDWPSPLQNGPRPIPRPAAPVLSD